MLLCTVRDCRMPLVREGPILLCPRGHSFDIARSGYINLLQPQDRRSLHPGDSADVIASRRRLHDRGVTAPLLSTIAEMAAPTHDDIALDAGCGDGFVLGSLAREAGFDGHGTDISVAAIDAAARRYPECEWIVANADRFIPYVDGCFSLVLSITARMNAPEFRRVLRDDGRLLVAVPGPEDLIEVRRSGRHRLEQTIEAFAREFVPVTTRRITTVAELDEDAINDVRLSIYRPRGSRPVEGSHMTFSFDLVLFRPV